MGLQFTKIADIGPVYMKEKSENGFKVQFFQPVLAIISVETKILGTRERKVYLKTKGVSTDDDSKTIIDIIESIRETSRIHRDITVYCNNSIFVNGEWQDNIHVASALGQRQCLVGIVFQEINLERSDGYVLFPRIYPLNILYYLNQQFTDENIEEIVIANSEN
jgi:hypothetical protein